MQTTLRVALLSAIFIEWEIYESGRKGQGLY